VIKQGYKYQKKHDVLRESVFIAPRVLIVGTSEDGGITLRLVHQSYTYIDSIIIWKKRGDISKQIVFTDVWPTKNTKGG